MSNDKTKYGVLCLLNNKKCCGCDIKTWHEYGLKNNYFTDPNPVYPKLEELEAQGLISAVEPCGGQDPAQKTYQITDLGRKEFIDWKDKGRHLAGNLFPDLTTYHTNKE